MRCQKNCQPRGNMPHRYYPSSRMHYLVFLLWEIKPAATISLLHCENDAFGFDKRLGTRWHNRFAQSRNRKLVILAVHIVDLQMDRIGLKINRSFLLRSTLQRDINLQHVPQNISESQYWRGPIQKLPTLRKMTHWWQHHRALWWGLLPKEARKKLS